GGQGRLSATPAVPDAPAWPERDRRASDKDSNGHRTSSASGVAERRTWAPGSGSTVIACVDVQPATRSDVQPERNDLLWRLALRRMERCVRAGDQVCMLGGPRVAIVLGNGSNRVVPSALGRRLARAMGDHLAVGATGLDLRVAIGVGAGGSDVEPEDLAAAALSSVRLNRNRAGTNGHAEPSSFLAVTHVPGRNALAWSPWRHPSDLDIEHGCEFDSTRLPRRLDYRVLVPLSDDLELSHPAPVMPNGWSAFREDEVGASLAGPGLRVLLVDPEASAEHNPRPMIEAVAAVARQCGALAVLSPAVDTDSVLLDLYLSKPDVVVVVVQAEVPRHGSSQGPHFPWDRPARITRALRAAGSPVIALSVGASVAALAVCVEQGAVGLFHTDLLAQELARQAARRLNGNGGSSPGTYDEPRGPGQLPAPYDALVHLTPSERRVLFHMMEGRSAAEIATTLVVSLTTVRSHIRSILRKLNVNSQLAAVALAFGTLPDQVMAE
ncbi:MAG TPA: LuxR C-terminal-related transcriptional regulator, partial [Acidimicrobiales bacterium]|nr:LuxR C-terminal-related transcriptional regulator [Acidimicrobiales bacterium]